MKLNSSGYGCSKTETKEGKVIAGELFGRRLGQRK